MKLAVVVSLLLLTGCVATPVAREFPAVPAGLTAACAALIDVPATDKLSVVLATVTRTVTKLSVPAAEKLVNAKLILPPVVTV
jgi:hypothetical protein